MRILFILVFFAMLTCSRIERNNPFDPQSDAWAPPTVSIIADTAVAIRDTFFVKASAHDADGTVQKFIWERPGIFSDTTDTNVFRIAFHDSGLVKLTVKAMDNQNLISIADTCRIHIHLYAPTITTIPDTSISIYDSITITAHATDTNGSILTYIWALDGINFKDTTTIGFIKTAFPDSGVLKINVKAIDDDGIISIPAQTTLSILKDAPLVSFTGDATAPINTPITFTAQTSQKFGTIIKYRWDNGATPGYDDSTGSIYTYAFQAESTFTVRLEVTDDDGNKNIATKTIVVTNDAPIVTGLKDTTISVNDVVTFDLSATDSNGILKYYWDFGDGSINRFDTTTSATISHQFPNTARRCTTSVKIIDIYGKSATTHAVINVLSYAPIITPVQDTNVKCIDTVLISVSAKDSNTNGKILKYYWDIGADGWDDSTSTPSFHIAHPAGGRINVVWAACDDDGIMTKDTFAILFSRAPTTVNVSVPSTKSGWINFQSGMGSLPVTMSAVDPDGESDTLTYSLFLGASVESKVKVYSGKDSIYIYSGVSATDTIYWHCVVVDLLGDSVSQEGIFITPTRQLEMELGSDYSLFIKENNTLWGCGNNSCGQLGDGTTTHRLTPVQIMTNVKYACAGWADMAGWSDRHTMIIKTDQTLWACGNNSFGELGDGTSTNRLTPISIMSDVKCVSVGENHTMILKTDGTLWACGYNIYGQLGDGTTTNRLTPVQITSNVRSVSTGRRHTMIVKNDGTLWACGFNACGQLGDNTTYNRSTPVRIMTDVKSVTTGYDQTMIIRTDGTLWACGDNQYGQLGDGTTIERHSPFLIMSDVKSVSAGQSHAMIIKTDGTLWACGKNQYGQLSNGSNMELYSPSQVMSNILSVSAGGDHTIIFKSDGTLWSCGRNEYGQLGDGTTTTPSTPVRIQF